MREIKKEILKVLLNASETKPKTSKKLLATVLEEMMQHVGSDPEMIFFVLPIATRVLHHAKLQPNDKDNFISSLLKYAKKEAKRMKFVVEHNDIEEYDIKPEFMAIAAIEFSATFFNKKV